MNRNELIEAIQQVITPNGQKGITAESLANLLIEMVNATPEGGSSGSGHIVFYAGTPSEDFSALVLTPEQKAHNVKMFKAVKESPIAISASVDMTDYFSMIFGAEQGIDVSGLKYDFNSTATAYLPENVALAMGMEAECVFVESELLFLVFADGSTTLTE